MGSLRPPDLLYSFMLLVICFQFTKNSRLRFPVMIALSIAIIGQAVGSTYDLISIIGNICVTVAFFSHAIHKEGRLMLPIILYTIIFLIVQAIGYGFNITSLKSSISRTHGEISLASIAISAIIAFIINYMITKYFERNKKITKT